MNATDRYRIRPYQDDDEPAVLGLLQSALAGGPTGERTSAFFRWKHHANPFGRSFGLVAEEDGTLVGVRLLMRWRFLANDRVVRAVRAVDTATDPEHQGQGIFSRLTLAAVAALAEDTDLIFNTPNSQSAPGYLKMGWQQVGTMPVAVGVQRPLRFVGGLCSVERGEGTGVTPACALPPAATALADEPAVSALVTAAAPPTGRLRTDRSLEYLRWRYADAPGLDYRAIEVRRGDVLQGLAFGRPRYRGRLREFTLSEVVVRHGDGATARALFRRARKAGCDYAATHTGLGWLRRSAAFAGYARVPGRGIMLTARPLRTVHPDPADQSSYALALGDLEVF